MANLYLGLASLICLATAAALLIAEPFRSKPEPRYFELAASESGGSVRVDWDPNSSAVQSADSAKLEAVDGNINHVYNVEPKVLHQGGLEYRRRSDDVLLRLRLLKGSKLIDEAAVRVVSGSIPAPPAR